VVRGEQAEDEGHEVGGGGPRCVGRVRDFESQGGEINGVQGGWRK
jgi:hypothetical protein